MQNSSKFSFSLCTGLFVVAVAIQGRASTVQDQIRYLLDEEKGLRQALEARVQQLKVATAKLNSSIVTCQCPNTATKPSDSKIAYTGTLSSSKTSLTGNTMFNFTNDLVNVGNAFNTNSAHFVVPISGLYGFSLTLYMTPGRYWTGMRLVKNGNQILGARTGHYYYSSTNRQVNMATNYVIGNFSAGDEIWPQYATGTGTRLDGAGVTTFSGVLLHEF